jgi:single-stranded DNA-binding protein
MTAFVLISGSLWKNPEQRISSKTGKAFVTASIRTSSADNAPADFWNLLIFSETVAAELMRLTEGDKLAVQGTVKLEIYNNKISRTVFVDHVLALRQPPKERKPKAAKAAPAAHEQSTTTTGATAGLDDDLSDLPF